MSLPKPYYETPLGKLYHGDCLEIMPELGFMSLCITDPPYGINIAKTGRVGGTKPFGKSGGPEIKPKEYPKSDWDASPPPRIAFEIIRAASQDQIIFGANYFSNYLPPSKCWLVWDKDNTGNFSEAELAYTSFDLALRKIRWRWNGMLKEAPEERFHPTQKPVGLFAWILEKYGQDAVSVLDPYLGSGTTALACERLKKRWVGIEISEEYCAIAAKRIEAERKQLKLF
jgi:DNA modification methylase